MLRKSMIIAAIAASVAGVAIAKLPPPTEEQKAKADEAKAKAADAAKVQAELLSRAQDTAVQKHMMKMKGEGKAMPATAPSVAPAPAPATAPAAATK